ncbi:MAG: cell division protein ZapA [Thermodesulfobacteriota bacterium]
MAQRLTIRILGRDFTFETQADDIRAREVAQYFAEQVEKVERSLGVMTSGKELPVLVTAALGMANDYVALKAGHEEFVRAVGDWSQRALALAEAVETRKKGNGPA